MSAREFHEWRAYAELEPFGPNQTDWSFGLLAALMVNTHVPSSNVPSKPEDFYPHLRPETPEQTPEQMWAILGGTANGDRSSP